MISKNLKKDILTIPNLLSLLRLILIPVYVTIYLNATEQSDYYIAAAILAVSCLTDTFDGQIARKFNMISTTGKILDPVADKLTQFSLIVCLALRHPILWIMIVLFVIKEAFQLIMGYINLRKGKMLPGALIGGKICTTVLFVSLILMVLIPTLSETVINILVAVNTVFLLFSFGQYAHAYFRKDSILVDMSLRGDKES